jgi:hypothetical protein
MDGKTPPHLERFQIPSADPSRQKPPTGLLGSIAGLGASGQ